MILTQCKDTNDIENTQIYFHEIYENTQIHIAKSFENTQIWMFESFITIITICLIREKVVTFRMVKLNMLLSIFLITK